MIFIFAIGIFLFAVLVNCVHRGGGDDANFPIMIKNYNLLGWIKYRYYTWSGRVVAEIYYYIFGSLPLFVWKIVDIIFYGTMAIILYKYYELFNNDRNRKLDYIMAIFCILLPFGMNFGAMCDGVFWVTGSMNYLWIMAAGIIAFYPMFYYSVHKKYPNLIFCIVALLFGFVAGGSQEQIGAVLLAFCVLFLLYIFLKLKRRPIFLVVETAVVFVAFLVDFFSPGSHLRYIQEINDRIPTFLKVSRLKRTEYSYRWFLDATINHIGILLVLTWTVLIIMLIKKSTKNMINSICIGIMALALLFTSIKKSIPQFFDFHAKWGIAVFSKGSYINIVFWSIVLLSTVIAVYSLYDYSIRGIVAAIVVLATYASTIIMAFSPTMYESGCRTMFVPSVILCILVLKLINDCIVKFNKYDLILIAALLSYPIYQYLIFAQTFLTAFNYHYPW